MLADPAVLGTATDELYRAFADYPRPPWFEGCACCWAGTPTDRGVVAVAAPGGDRELRTLTADELEELAIQLPHLGGTIEVYKHYLPRLLELAAANAFDHPELEIIGSNLTYANLWTGWPAPEAGAIRGFLHAYWQDQLAGPPCRIGEALTAVAAADPDIDWYLDRWLAFETPAAARNLERYLADNSHALARGRLADDFFVTDHGPGGPNQARVIAWLQDPATHAALEKRLLRWDRPRNN